MIKSAMIEITLNGAPLRLDQPLTVAELLIRQGWAGKRVAVECDGEIVPRSRHPEVRLTGGECLEIVVAVGGG